MRLAVLDVGSNTVHLLVVDAHEGARPLPAYSDKSELRLAEHLTDDGRIDDAGRDRLVECVRHALEVAEDRAPRTCWRSPPRRCVTRRTARRCSAAVRDETGVDLEVLDRGRRGAADLPRRPPLVRLVVGPAAGDGHRRWVAGDGGRHRRGAGRDRVAAAGRRPADPRRCCRATRRARTTSRRCASTCGRGGRPAPPVRGDGRGRPRGGDVEDLQAAGPAHRCTRVGGVRARATDAVAGRPERVGATARRDDRTPSGAACPACPSGRAPQLLAGAVVAEAVMALLGHRRRAGLPVGAARRHHPAPARLDARRALTARRSASPVTAAA